MTSGVIIHLLHDSLLTYGVQINQTNEMNILSNSLFGTMSPAEIGRDSPAVRFVFDNDSKTKIHSSDRAFLQPESLHSSTNHGFGVVIEINTGRFRLVKWCQLFEYIKHTTKFN